jgi:carbonic anhydrase/acetyltransferase-like protein (isoleucine patch superfamily)
VDLAAVVTVPSAEDFGALSSSHSSASSKSSASSRTVNSPLMPILGNDVLRGWMDRIRKLGVRSLWLASSSQDRDMCSALQAFARQGIERFLVIKLKSYAEMDLADLLAFHYERHSTVTEVHDSQGRLGVRVLSHPAPPTGGATCECCVAAESERTLYSFRGYAKRILSARERQDLVGDALTGTCALRPLGKEIGEHVWIGEGASVATSSRVIGPSYIGARTIIRAGATIGPFTSVERDSVVEYGTVVERSTVLPRTRLAAGLRIRNGLVDGRYLEDLRSGIVADLKPAGLAWELPETQTNRQTSSDVARETFLHTETWTNSLVAETAAWREMRL